MKRLRPQEASIASLAILLTMAAAPPLIKIHPVLAQTPAPAATTPIALPSGTRVKIDGSSSLIRMNEALKQRFEQQFPGTKVELGYGGMEAAISALLNGKVDLVAIGRPLTADEKAKGLVLAPIARNKIAIIVGSGNPFKKSLTLAQFAKIFRGEITDWSKVGRSAGPIRVIDRPDTSDTRQAFQNYPVFQNAPFQAGANAVKLSEDNTEAVVKGLGTNGIGYAIADQVTGKSGIHIVAMHNTLPTDAKYPFSQPLGYVYKGPEPTPGVKAFLDYAIAPANQQVVEQARVAGATEPSPEPAPEATASPDQSFVPPDSVNTVSTPVPWWGWWLSLPLLGGLLWWLLKRRGADPIAAPAPVAAAGIPAGVPEGQIILVPRNCRDAYVYWEIPAETQAAFHRQGVDRLAVRLYDVTDIDLDQRHPHSVQQFGSDGRSPDLHIPIPVDNRDYLAELGYLTHTNHWLRVTRSKPVRVPACVPAGGDFAAGENFTTGQDFTPEGTVTASFSSQVGDVIKAGGASLAGATGATAVGKALSGDRTMDDRSIADRPIADRLPGETESRIILVPRTADDVYVYWEVPESAKAELRHQGGEKLALRLYDVTGGIDLERQPPHGFRQFDADELTPDRHLPVAVSDRDYIAELGYVTDSEYWLKLVRSQPVHVPSQFGSAFPNG